MSLKGDLRTCIKVFRKAQRERIRAERLNDQRLRVSRYERVREVLRLLCDTIRQAAQEFDPECVEARQRLEQLFDRASACERALLLALVPPDRHDQLDSQVADRASEPANLLRTVEPMAYAEMRLRSLAVLVLRCGRDQTPESLQVPEWKHMLEEAKKDHREAIRWWKALGLSQLTCQDSHLGRVGETDSLFRKEETPKT